MSKIDQALKPIKAQLSSLSSREKTLMLATFLTVFGYLTYTFVLEATIKDIMSKTSKVVTLQLQLQRKQEVQRRMMDLGDEIKRLQAEVKEKRERRDRLDREMKARKQIEEILDSLETTAKATQLTLEKMEVDTKVTTKSRDYQKIPFVPNGGSNDAEPETKSVRIKYIQNQISITCSSDYKALLNYLTEIKKLPYALSVVNLNMYKPSLGGPASGKDGKDAAGTAGGTKYDKGTLLSEIDLEIYFK